MKNSAFLMIHRGITHCDLFISEVKSFRIFLSEYGARLPVNKMQIDLLQRRLLDTENDCHYLLEPLMRAINSKKEKGGD